MTRQVVVAGGSIAALTAVEMLRMEEFDGRITVLTDEDVPPYTRVPLSKGVLAGTGSIDDIVLAPLAAEVDLRLKAPATALDPDTRTVHTPAGPVSYDGLVIATGGRARRLGRPDQDERVLRSQTDGIRLREELPAVSSVLVIRPESGVTRVRGRLASAVSADAHGPRRLVAGRAVRPSPQPSVNADRRHRRLLHDLAARRPATQPGTRSRSCGDDHRRGTSCRMMNRSPATSRAWTTSTSRAGTTPTGTACSPTTTPTTWWWTGRGRSRLAVSRSTSITEEYIWA